MPGRVLVVRHGATAWSRAGRHTGRTDIPLDQGGEAQARALGVRLGVRAFALVLVSPLLRARRTCELAGLLDGAEVCAELAEWDYGDYEGRTTPEIRHDRPGWSIWRDGCPGGETLDQVGDRADRVLAQVRRAGGDVALFGHGHILRVVTARWLGLSPAAGEMLVLGAGALGVLDWERDTPVLGRWDDDGGDPLG
ncbi:MAG: histidine phosphatase family protein [Acidimicrobiales bacterium]